MSEHYCFGIREIRQNVHDSVYELFNDDNLANIVYCRIMGSLEDFLYEKESEWIPVSERLPEEKEAEYLVCTDDGYACLCRWTDDKYGLGVHGEWGWHVIDKPQYSKIVAWMSYEPYKGE